MISTDCNKTSAWRTDPAAVVRCSLTHPRPLPGGEIGFATPGLRGTPWLTSFGWYQSRRKSLWQSSSRRIAGEPMLRSEDGRSAVSTGSPLSRSIGILPIICGPRRSRTRNRTDANLDGASYAGIRLIGKNNGGNRQPKTRCFAPAQMRLSVAPQVPSWEGI